VRFHRLASAFPSSVVALGVLLVAFPFASAHMAWRDLADASWRENEDAYRYLAGR